ncbi:uncharacterized protein EAE97_009173 [Botrytis byssoidea]|uniref:Uncharacterized protein n=1 Tax=Botrytis byssoidea TaxID=139641 RepID=A0A9P5LZB1_9HELO|nr:uncharacterized protein EAE97_009173 [Botrytis byssoidea]KAF7932152.1 hypothetical protein EAE97_009173 [Botrytis byssoidea]
MSVSELPSILSRTVFYNLNGTRSEGIRIHVRCGFERVLCELSTIEKESIRVAILDTLSWEWFDSYENCEIACVFPNLKEIIFLCAKPENLFKYSMRNSALQLQPLRPGRYVETGPKRHYLTERRSLRIEKLIRKQHGKPLDTDDEKYQGERDEDGYGVGFLGDGDEELKREEEDPTDFIGQGEHGFREYLRWEDKREEY